MPKDWQQRLREEPDLMMEKQGLREQREDLHCLELILFQMTSKKRGKKRKTDQKNLQKQQKELWAFWSVDQRERRREEAQETFLESVVVAHYYLHHHPEMRSACCCCCVLLMLLLLLDLLLSCEQRDENSEIV